MSETSFFCCRFLVALVKINPQIVGGIMEHLRNEIYSVELMRGNGKDNRLRNFMESIEQSLL